MNTISTVNFILDYETGNTTDLETVEGFAHLIRTGQAWSLQGHYGQAAAMLIEQGYITEDGEVTDLAYDTLDTPEGWGQ